MLKQSLRNELKQSMMARDTIKTSVLRMLLSAITYYEINIGGAGYEATDKDVVTVLEKEVKQRRDSIEQYEKAKRNDLADQEKIELGLLSAYLPKQLTEKEIEVLVQNAIEDTGSISLQDIGKIMSYLMPKIKGKADGNIVNKIVRSKLGIV